jgi:hypothetical protein
MPYFRHSLTMVGMSLSRAARCASSKMTRVSDAILGTAPEHVLIKVVEDEGREGTLQVFILRAVDLYQCERFRMSNNVGAPVTASNSP